METALFEGKERVGRVVNPRTHGRQLNSGTKTGFTVLTFIRTGIGVIQWLLERENVGLHATTKKFVESLTDFAKQ